MSFERALLALDGLSVGDAFGERWFSIAPEIRPMLMQLQAMPAPVWDYTDDTQMALSIVAILQRYGAINQEELARSFAQRYSPPRKYGASMRGLFEQINDGVAWQVASKTLFAGQGSYGNGAAMRVAPIGAYFADDIQQVIQQAQLSAEVTHAHPEGIAGAIAVAVAVAYAYQLRGQPITRAEFIDHVLPHIPESEVKSKIVRARDLATTNLNAVISVLGNGIGISAQDTVPLCLWCAGENLNSYEGGLWVTASCGGDVDTTCAIVGGILAVSTGQVPEEWLTYREPLPSWYLT